MNVIGKDERKTLTWTGRKVGGFIYHDGNQRQEKGIPITRTTRIKGHLHELIATLANISEDGGSLDKDGRVLIRINTVRQSQHGLMIFAKTCNVESRDGTMRCIQVLTCVSFILKSITNGY